MGLRSEKPFLIYPLGTLTTTRKRSSGFRAGGVSSRLSDPLALARRSERDLHRNKRARVVIAFFGLNSRDELLWGRAEKLRELEKSLALINSGTPEQVMHAKADIVRLTDGFSEHTACIRAMLRLCDRDLEDGPIDFSMQSACVSRRARPPRRTGNARGSLSRAPPTSA